MFIRHTKLLFLTVDKENIFYLVHRATAIFGIRRGPRHLHETVLPITYPAHNAHVLDLSLANVVHSLHATSVLRLQSRPQRNAVQCVV